MIVHHVHTIDDLVKALNAPERPIRIITAIDLPFPVPIYVLVEKKTR